MKQVFVAVLMLSLLVMGGLAGTADAAGPHHNWTGFYIGLNAGAAFNDSDYDLRPSGPGYAGDPNNSLRKDSGDFDNTSFTGGAQAGYNYQINNFVIGLETDFNYNGINESDHVSRELRAPLGGRFSHTVTQKLDYLGTLRARVGFTPANLWLVYATGGLAYGRVSSSSRVMFTEPVEDKYHGSSSSTQAGWTVGGGVEYAVAKQWSIKGEYLYVDLGSNSYEYENQAKCANRCSYVTDLNTREHIVRFGINYKF